MASVRMAAAASEPCSPAFGTPIRSKAAPSETASVGNGASEKSIPRNRGALPLALRGSTALSAARVAKILTHTRERLGVLFDLRYERSAAFVDVAAPH